MARGDRSAHPHRGVSGAFRGTVGYHGVSADDAADPVVVFPPRPVTVPASATSPLTAGSDTIAAGGGVTVDNGTDQATVSTLVAAGAVIAGNAATLVTTRILGPFRIQPSTPSVTDGSVAAFLADLNEGDTVISAWAVNYEAWNGGASRIAVDIGDGDTIATGMTYIDPAAVVGSRSDQVLQQNSPNFPFLVTVINAPGMSLRADVDATSPTTGDTDIYAVVATPAA